MARKTAAPSRAGRPPRARGCRSQATAAQVQLNRRICAAGQESQHAVLELVSSCCAELSLVNVSTAWHCMARLQAEGKPSPGAAEDPRLAMLGRRTKALLSQFLASEGEEPHPRCVSTITWSCAKLKARDPEALGALGGLAVRWLPSFKPFELSNVLWGFAKLQVAHASLFQAAHDHVAISAQLFSTRSLSMIAWAFATSHVRPCRGLLLRMTDAFVSGLALDDEANPVTIANMVWALATARVHARGDALGAIGDAASAGLASFRAHELSITLWAFARLSSCHEGVFAGAIGLLCSNQRLREEIHSQGIANLLWALARHRQETQHRGVRSLPDVLGALLPTCVRLLPKLNSVELSSTVWAISKLACRWGQHPAADHLLAAAAERLLAEPGLLAGMSPQGCAGALAAYSEFICGCLRAPAPLKELTARLVRVCAGHGLEGRAAQDDAVTDAPPGRGSCGSPRESGAHGHAAASWAEPAAGLRVMAATAGAATAGARGMDQASPPALSGLVAPEQRPGAHAARQTFPAAPSVQPWSAAQLRAAAQGSPELAYAPPGPPMPRAPTRPGDGIQNGEDSALGLGVPLTNLVQSDPVEVDLEQQLPTASFIPEFCSDTDNWNGGGHVDVAFVVDCADDVAALAVDVYAHRERQDSFTLSAEECGVTGVCKITLPEHEGRWSVCITMMDAWGRRLGRVASLSFLGRRSDNGQRLKPQDYTSTASTCLQAESSRGEGSSCSSAGDSDHEAMPAARARRGAGAARARGARAPAWLAISL